MNRRDFIKSSAAASFAIATAPAIAADFADMKKRVGLIGTGWYGKIDLLRLIQVAPVEVASRQKSGKKPRLYSDYREMLKEKDLDIVLVGTPDHWHALTMIEAVKSGADVYVQKPISVDVTEGQA